MSKQQLIESLIEKRAESKATTHAVRVIPSVALWVTLGLIPLLIVGTGQLIRGEQAGWGLVIAYAVFVVLIIIGVVVILHVSVKEIERLNNEAAQINKDILALDPEWSTPSFVQQEPISTT